MDFTVKKYISLLRYLQLKDYYFQTFTKFLQSPQEKTIVLRHDVDRSPKNALRLAKLENEYGIRSSYYFRIVKKSNDPDIIKAIANLGHEIGYHYEDLSITNGNKHLAIKYFKKIKLKGLSRLPSPSSLFNFFKISPSA